MGTANSNIQLADLDFQNIKSNFIQYLQSQNILKDYDYAGSALSTLLDVLAYNTQYNAFYLNMVANEMFLDSAVQRSSVVSQAKLLDYTPKSVICPSATISMNVYGVTASSLTIPQYTQFLSESVDGVNYTFITNESTTVNTSANNVAVFSNLTLTQGTPSTYSFTVDSVTNPTYTFEIPDPQIDTTTLQVIVQQTSSNAAYQIYTLAQDYLVLNSTSTVYFLQEGISGNFQLVFGDGVLGQQLTDGNVITVNYLSSQGTASAGANNFSLMGTLSGYGNVVINPLSPASQGGDKESIASIKFQAPKAYSAQNRAVSKEDYITLIQQNQLGYSFDAVNVWGGEENNPPVYGQVFVSMKPTGAYSLTDTQKQRIINEVIAPVSVLTVQPTVVDPDYTYIKVTVNVLYNPTQTTSTSNQIQSAVIAAIQNFATSTLNTFNSTLNSYDMQTAIQNADQSIITSEFSIQLQKKFYPNLTTPTTYSLNFGVPLQRGILLSGINSSPALQFKDPTNPSNVIDGIYIEEVPVTTYGIDSIQLINPGFSYQSTPTVTIQGDGTGATAYAAINPNGQINSITVTNSGNNYTQATVTITPAIGDSSGQNGAATVTLQGQYGTLRSYYNTANNVKTIYSSNVGTVDYTNGIITLDSFSPLNVDNPLGQLIIGVNPTTTIISSTYNKIITVDPYDPLSVVVNVSAKS
jgi:hypothetical protein